MRFSGFIYAGRVSGALLLGAMLLSGCRSQKDEAIEKAKQQAVATGQPQQVVSTDKDGTTTTITVQPPAPVQGAQATTANQAPPANAPAAANAPAVIPASPDGQMASGTGAQQPTLPGGQPAVQPAGVSVVAGTPLTIRINQHISVKHSHAGDRFDGEIAEPVAGANNAVVIPKGAHVSGVVVESHRRGHFKGASILELRLTSLTLNGTRYDLNTKDLTRTKKGKGKRTAAFIGGGSGLGMLVGGVATGGVGLLVGGLVGAGAGTAAGGLTGNRDIDIPAESIVKFRLAEDLVIQPS